MTERNTVLRSLHDVGLAAWFGGSLMGAVGLNGAARSEGDTEQTSRRFESTGWARWTPVNAAAIAGHLVGSVGLLEANAARVAGQRGVGASSLAKTAVTTAALAVTAYSRAQGKKVERLSQAPRQEGTEQLEQDQEEARAARRQLTVLQWAVPALTGGLIVLNALHGEQQRPWQQVLGRLQRALGH
ncbi:hypothetical protein GCM10019016_098780 [Streptomyces prasinosporus]|uniref:ABC-type Mn/Zn transport systems, ATPase component n=1 Tax=Streptomyces prasinosporus TaxID=68256 RepID=A0ABP6U5R2_9ACTN